MDTLEDTRKDQIFKEGAKIERTEVQKDAIVENRISDNDENVKLVIVLVADTVLRHIKELEHEQESVAPIVTRVAHKMMHSRGDTRTGKILNEGANIEDLPKDAIVEA